MVIISVTAAFGAHVHDDDWRRYIGPVMILVCAPAYGLLDGRGRLSVARRHYAQAGLAAVLSTPLYGEQVALYTAGFLVGRRHPANASALSIADQRKKPADA